MERDSKKMRGDLPFCFTNIKDDKGVDTIIKFIVSKGGLKK